MVVSICQPIQDVPHLCPITHIIVMYRRYIEVKHTKYQFKHHDVNKNSIYIQTGEISCECSG